MIINCCLAYTCIEIANVLKMVWFFFYVDKFNAFPISIHELGLGVFVLIAATR